MHITEDYQKKLFPYAYHILGSADDARDVIQDVVLNYIEKRSHNIENSSAYLIKSVINRSITLKDRSKKMVGQTTWLPEPVATEGADQWINSREILSFTLMVLLEHLNAKERAVFILKEAFDYSHEQIADVFGFSTVNSRQLLRRAKKLLKEKDPELRIARSPQGDTLFQYVEAIKRGHIGLLETMLSENITSQSDGGGKIKVLSEFSSGITSVAQLSARVYALYLRKCRIEFKSINYQPALLFYKENRLVCCQVLAISPATGKIHQIYNVVDPGKLKSL